MKISHTHLSILTLLAALASASSSAATTAAGPKPLEIGGLEIGTGRPEVIIPTTGKTADEVLEQARRIAAHPKVDLAELRIDYLDIATDAEALGRLGRQVGRILGDKPIILTFRTRAEGGTTAITDADYAQLYLQLIEAGFAELLDLEMTRDEAVIRQIVAAAHAKGMHIVMSSHDFQRTPSTAELVARLKRQEALGADILKIAVMPQDAGDVLQLLQATWEMRQQSQHPLLTMSMGGTGVISRLSGEAFGQAMTFGMLGEPSAPGQVDAEQLDQVLGTIHQAMTR